MPRDGVGSYIAPEAAVVTGTPISSVSYNNSLADIGTALTGSVAADGQTPMTGPLTLAANPTLNLQAAPKQYVDATAATQAATRVAKAGDTMTGNLAITAATAGLTLTGTTVATAEVTASGSTGFGVRMSSIGPGGSILTGGNTPLLFVTNGVERARVAGDGGVYVGAASGGSGLPGIMHTLGYNCRPGYFGAFTANTFLIDWTGASADLWINTTNVGTLQFTSDRRVKHSIEPLGSVLDALMRLRPVSYRFADIGVFRDDGATRWGFIADEVQAEFPAAVTGQPDAVDDAGNVAPQSIVDRPLIAVLVKAVQELTARVEALEAAS